jgi:ribosomal protein S18 acetylase RimI-like enzyme
MMLNIEPITNRDDLRWCAETMAGSEPWITLRRPLAACLGILSNAAKERYVIRAAGERAGLLVLDLTGPFAGYVQSICIAEQMRGRGFGSQTLAWAEDRIFRDSPNVFMCVSSFNEDARRLYARLGYEQIATLAGFVVADHDELLLRKTQGSWEWFRSK